MECSLCRHDNPQEARFCEDCGSPLEHVCPQCSRAVSPTARFCITCGHDLSQAAAPAGAAPARKTPRAPRPPSVPAAATGERRLATVMFSDLSGYTAMNEQLDPEEVERVMRRIKSEAVRIVEGHGGIVNQFVGDEVLALFGIPTAHEDDPRRAVQAALELHEAVRGVSPEVEGRIGRALRMHSGINSGLIVTNLQDTRDGTYGITGDTVNTGARLKAMAGDDSVLVSPETRRLVEPYFRLQALPPVKLRGKQGQVVPYRVAGASGAESRLEAAELRGFTPYIGRAAELAALQGCLERAAGGHGQFVTVSGEAGLGKSRLLYEFRHGIDRDAVTVLQGRCQAEGTATPYLPLADALRRGLGLGDDASADAVQELVAANVCAIDPALGEYLPYYFHLLSIPTQEFALPAGLSGEDLRMRLQEALAAIMTQNAGHKPMVLLLEDWHWVDDGSDAALRYMVGLIEPHRLLVVVTHRPEYPGGWSANSNHTALPLGALSPGHTGAIAAAVLEAEQLPEGFADLIHERTGGNPFFIEEICRDLLEDGTVQVGAGKATLTRSLDTLTLPTTVQAVIRSRLDRLDEPHREILRLASVIGREFGQRLLEQAHPGNDALTANLEALKGQGLIQQVRVLPEVAYLFRHVLAQVVVYETLLLERRKTLHGLVGQALEELYADRLEEHYERLAYHYQHSNEVERAIRYLELAGDKAGGFFDWKTARADYLAAIADLQSLEMTPARKTQFMELALKLMAVAYHSPEPRFLDILETARRYATEQDDNRRLLRVAYGIGQLHYVVGRMGTDAMRSFEDALALADRFGDPEIRARAANYLGRVCFHTVELDKGIKFLEEGIPLLEQLGIKADTIYSQSMLSRLYALAGRFPEARELAETALGTSRAIANHDRESNSSLFFGFVLALQGDWEAAITYSGIGVDLAERLGNHTMLAVGLAIKGYATVMGGDAGSGIAMLEKSIERISPGSTGMLIFRAWMGEALALAGHTEQARRAIVGMQALIGVTGQHSGDIAAARTLAVLAAEQAPPGWAGVEDHIAEAIRLADGWGARPDLGISLFRHAELLHLRGDTRKSREPLTRATALFGEMGMTWWLEQAEELRGRIEKGDAFKWFAPFAAGPPPS